MKRNEAYKDYPYNSFCNIRSLSKHVDVIASDYRIINNDIIGLTETQINPSDSTSKIIKIFEFFKY